MKEYRVVISPSPFINSHIIRHFRWAVIAFLYAWYYTRFINDCSETIVQYKISH